MKTEKRNRNPLTTALGGMDATVTKQQWRLPCKLPRLKSSWMMILIACSLLISIIACDDGNNKNNPTTYTVTFDADNGTVNTTQTVPEGNKATKPSDPTKDGYNFDYWFNTATDTEWDFDTAVIANLSLKGQWTTKFEGTWKTPFQSSATTKFIFNKNNVIYNYNGNNHYKGTFTFNFTESSFAMNLTHNWSNDNNQWTERSEPIILLFQYNNFKDKDSFVVNTLQNGSENTSFLGTWEYE